MAQVQVMYWKDIPYSVKAVDEQGQVKAMLPDRFQQAVDAAAMVDGHTDEDAYLEGFVWGAAQERPGSAQEALNSLVAELEYEYSPERIREMVRERKAS